MNLEMIDKVLEKHNLKKTALRRHILGVLADSKRPLSQADIILAMTKSKRKVDRVSVYRNLVSLIKAEVLHEVDVNSYVFCSHECDHHAHLLLYCRSCQKHREIKEHDRIDQFFRTLQGFRFFGHQQPIFLRGICSACSTAQID